MERRAVGKHAATDKTFPNGGTGIGKYVKDGVMPMEALAYVMLLPLDQMF